MFLLQPRICCFFRSLLLDITVQVDDCGKPEVGYDGSSGTATTATRRGGGGVPVVCVCDPLVFLSSSGRKKTTQRGQIQQLQMN